MRVNVRCWAGNARWWGLKVMDFNARWRARNVRWWGSKVMRVNVRWRAGKVSWWRLRYDVKGFECGTVELAWSLPCEHLSIKSSLTWHEIISANLNPWNGKCDLFIHSPVTSSSLHPSAHPSESPLMWKWFYMFISHSKNLLIRLSIHPPAHSVICLSIQRSTPSSICTSVCQSTVLFILLFVHPSLHVSFHPSANQFFCLSCYLSIRLFIYLSIHLLIHLRINPSVHPTIWSSIPSSYQQLESLPKCDMLRFILVLGIHRSSDLNGVLIL